MFRMEKRSRNMLIIIMTDLPNVSIATGWSTSHISVCQHTELSEQI